MHQVLQLLLDNQFDVNANQCKFGVVSVDYLGHVVSKQGVEVGRSKVAAVQDWPTPRTVRALRGFLGLAGYSRKFVRNFAQIAAPLHKLLSKNGFHWEAES